MSEQDNGGPLNGPLIIILLGGLEKAYGASYRKIVAETPWARFLTKPPSNDPQVIESNGDEWAKVCAEIYRQAGRDLFISFARRAGVESARMFTVMLAKQVKAETEGLDSLARLQRVAAIQTAALNTQVTTISVENIAAGVLVTIKPCVMCSLLQSNEPVCTYITEGMRSSYTALAEVKVVAQEVECQAMGKVDHCRFKVTLS
jgi:predicted hydrocarbon binding protein